LESGEKFDDDNPRIVLSTIHKAKGGEADNVALLLKSSKACCTMGDPDCEKRVFYVGATRAKQNLHIIEAPAANWSFRI
jgi:ATP-dependent exoDNAse (exonuclease V) alpha subunit